MISKELVDSNSTVRNDIFNRIILGSNFLFLELKTGIILWSKVILLIETLIFILINIFFSLFSFHF